MFETFPLAVQRYLRRHQITMAPLRFFRRGCTSTMSLCDQLNPLVLWSTFRPNNFHTAPKPFHAQIDASMVALGLGFV